MPFRLGKSEQQPKDEEAAVEENLEGSEVTPTGNSDNSVHDGDSAATATAPAAEDKPQGGRQRIPTFRRAFLDEAVPDERAATTTPPPEGDAFFVAVTEDGMAEVHRFDDPAEAQAFIEQLLQKDVPEEEVAAFSGRRLSLMVSHRPVVKLSIDQEE
ncbi:MAG: hypothetical protein IH864_02140 [Chloroflexi bacterium]|nr:hypothetical protein [Chloroflexota bacterium]